MADEVNPGPDVNPEEFIPIYQAGDGTLIPDDALPVSAIVIATYMDPNDRVIYDDYRVIGACTLRDALGTLESIKMRMAFDQYGLFGDPEEQ